MKVSEKFAPGLISNLPTVAIISLSGAFICTSTVLRALKYFTSFDTIGPLTVFSLLTIVVAAWIFSWQQGLAQTGRNESVYLFSLLLLWAIISLATIYIYPLFNSCQQYSGGSDRDEALDAATRSLLNFSYPYLAQVKSLACNINVGPGGNPISPMPGELILAIPFVLMGASAWQNLFWLLAWMFVLRDLLSSYRNLGGLFFLIVLSPTVFAAELLTGGDLLAISLQAFVITYLLWRVDRPNWLGYTILPVLLGIALSSRPQMILVLPLLLALIRDTQGWRTAWIKTGVAAISWCSVTLPFYFANPSHFSPLHANSFFERFGSVLPYPKWFMAAILAILIGFFFRKTYQNFQDFCIALGAILIMPAIFLTTLSSLSESRVEMLNFSWYGLTGWIFLAAGFWPSAELKGA